MYIQELLTIGFYWNVLGTYRPHQVLAVSLRKQGLVLWAWDMLVVKQCLPWSKHIRREETSQSKDCNPWRLLNYQCLRYASFCLNTCPRLCTYLVKYCIFLSLVRVTLKCFTKLVSSDEGFLLFISRFQFLLWN